MWEKLKSKHFWTDGYGSLAVAVLIALSIRWALVEAYVIPSGSMLPTLLIRDHIFVNKLVYGVRYPFTKSWLVQFGTPKRGEVIVFRNPKQPDVFFIKRVIGLPGDRISYIKSRLYINDQPVPRELSTNNWAFDWLRDEDFRESMTRKEDYAHWDEDLNGVKHSVLTRKSISPLSDYEGDIVPEGFLFAMGDNRDNSWDSRGWGYVPVENVLGRAMFVWLSCEQGLPVVDFLCNPLTIRWGRFFHGIH